MPDLTILILSGDFQGIKSAYPAFIRKYEVFNLCATISLHIGSLSLTLGNQNLLSAKE